LEDCLFCDLEDFDFPHLEIFSTGENDGLVQSDVIGTQVAKASQTWDVCVATAVEDPRNN
jgi:hypothetical protein